MAGILDKKSRLFDYQITTNGRSQIQNNDIRYTYATFSDSSIVYYKDYDKTKDYKREVDGSEFYYLPLESTTKENVEFVREFKFNEENKSYTDLYSFNNSQSNLSLIDFSKEKVKEISISKKVQDQKIILTKSGFSPDTFSFKMDSSLENGEFNFRNTVNINNYPTILNTTTTIKNVSPIYNDKRFSNKINFMKMPPVNQDDEDVFERSSFVGLEEFDRKSSLDFLFKSFNENVTFQNESSREKSIKNILSTLENSKEILKKEYYLNEEDNIDTMFLEMFEVQENSNNTILEKLIHVKVEEIFDEVTGKYKTIYMIGKVKYNNRELNLEEIKANLKDNLRKFNAAFNDSDGYDFKIYKLSNFYSFINMFILVAE